MDETRVCQYFERIGLTMPENIVPDAALLEKLTFHNIISIPYENTQFLTKGTSPAIRRTFSGGSYWRKKAESVMISRACSDGF